MNIGYSIHKVLLGGDKTVSPNTVADFGEDYKHLLDAKAIRAPTEAEKKQFLESLDAKKLAAEVAKARSVNSQPVKKASDEKLGAE